MKSFFSSCVVLSFVLFLIGCEDSQEGPEAQTYSEAITIYNQELALLDRLKKEQSNLRQEREPRGIRFAEKLLGDASDLQEEFSKTLEELDPTLSTDTSGSPGEGEENDPFRDVREQVRQLRDESEEDVQSINDRLEELGKEIAEQEERVQRAKDDLDAARLRERAEP